ncbi:hypothetical protein [Flavihumibacter solisilvae]|uniref:hypothetical protein n=1 Tax=Flavihumibacter solisilvae TaxID=1349421 RepID=UPI00068A3F3B|nr:hypothetical protein [Flavihumibacter solisilvae]
MPLRSSILMLLLSFYFYHSIAQQKHAGQADNNTQKIDSIAFHLYTDSLKKGVYNYINVDGLQSSGRWIPLTAQDIRLSCDYGRFEGNNLIIDSSCGRKMVNITAVYNRNPSLSKSITVYIKTLPDNEQLKTKEQILEEMSGKKKKRKKG